MKTLQEIHGDGNCHICGMPMTGEGSSICSYPHGMIPDESIGNGMVWKLPPKHEYPSNYPPGCHWAITEAWTILDSLPVDTLDMTQRSFLAGMIAGALMKAKGD